ncbi:carbohydrate kinase family protein [Hoeflea sp.]|uniref:carbohydrate kinase family protein n=1 Tax=Hoeflea sp. TaxID=1940281 RepID=UPI003A921C10
MSGAAPICVIGNANLDVLIGPVDDMPRRGTEVFRPLSDVRIGGSAANTAIVLKRLGARCGLVSCYGHDESGALIAGRFSSELDRLTRLEAPTSLSVGLLHSDGERSFISSQSGHLDLIDKDLIARNLSGWPLDKAVAILSGAFTMPRLLQDASAVHASLLSSGAILALDPGWPGNDWDQAERDKMTDWAAACDHLLINELEAMAFSGETDLEAAARKIQHGMKPGATLVIKCGREGARAFQGSLAFQAAGRPVHPVDTVGAGDSFNAGYLDQLARGKPVARCLEAGVDVASAVLSEFPRGYTSLKPVITE